MIEDVLDYFDHDDHKLLICRERERGSPILHILSNQLFKPSTRTAFLIGPEGGWSPKEEALFDERSDISDNIQSVSLGDLVLRAETCAIAAATAWKLLHDQADTEI